MKLSAYPTIMVMAVLAVSNATPAMAAEQDANSVNMHENMMGGPGMMNAPGYGWR